MKKGEWVLIDGIELSPKEIIEKISTLLNDNPELHVFESGKNIYYRKKDIHPNFHLFITYNPCNLNSKNLDKLFLNKCLSFTLPQIDSNQKDTALLLFNSLNNIKSEEEQKIMANICSRLANVHSFSVNESLNYP